MDVDVRPLQDDELDAAHRLTSDAFGDPSRDAEAFRAGTQGCATMGAFEAGSLVAFARSWAFGQWFGGRSVPMGGVASVAVAPEARGRGHASAILSALLEGMRERGQVVSTLFPATTRLYRGMGWEVAGAWSVRSVPTRSLVLLPNGARDAVRRATLDDVPAIKACYGRLAPSADGFLDRPDLYWDQRLLRPWDTSFVYVVDGDDGDVDGYVVYRHTKARGGFGMHVQELVAAHGDAWLALWRLLGASSSQVKDVVFQGSPEDPLLLALPEQDVTSEYELRWLLRVVDGPGAVAARGFPPGVRIGVDLDLRDRGCPGNEGRWRLTVEDGRGHLEKGGTGDVRLGANAFATLWAGHTAARVLARRGLLSGGSARDIAALDAAFAGPTPWMPDFF